MRSTLNGSVLISCAAVALLATYGWTTVDGSVATLPGLLGTASGTGAVAIERRCRDSTVRSVVGFALVAFVVAVLIRFENGDAFFFGMLLTWSILVTAGVLYAIERHGA